MICAITYDLNRGGHYHLNGQDYPDLYEKIESLGETIHPLQNLWFLNTTLDVDTISNEIRRVIDNNDFLFVTQLNNGYCSGILPQDAVTWLDVRL